MNFRWLLTDRDGVVMEICSSPPFTIAEVRERYPDRAVESLPEKHYPALKVRKQKEARYVTRA